MNMDLTQRETEILRLLAEGYNNGEISDKLFISNHTTKTHLEKIYYKLGVHNRVQAAILAFKNGLISEDDK